MTRFRSLILDAVLGVAFMACGSNSDGGAGGAGGTAPGTGGVVSSTGGSGAGGAAGGAGGSSGKTILDAIPRDNDVAGWTVDQSNSKTKGKVAATATDEATTEGFIDGAAAEFFKSPLTPVMFAWQNYINTTLPSAPVAPDPLGVKVDLHVLQMPDAGQASTLYSSLLTDTLYSKWTWVDPSSPTVGDKSRVTNAGDAWWINFTKGAYYVEVKLTPSYGPAPDYTENDQSLKTAAFDFAAVVAKKM
jgi:hypothetical protein